jgi:hypothetical protein
VIIGPPVNVFRFVGNSSVFTNSLFRRRQHHNFLRLEINRHAGLRQFLVRFAQARPRIPVLIVNESCLPFFVLSLHERHFFSLWPLPF